MSFVWTRLASASGHAIENLVAREEAEPDARGSTFSRGLDALKRTHAVVFVVDDQAHRFKRYVRNLGALRADLSAAGHVPEEVPVVIQIDHPMLEGVATRPVSDLVEALRWPHCDHVEAFPMEKRGAKEALDRAIDLYEEMQAEGNGPTR